MPTPSSSQPALRALLHAKGTRLVLMRKASSFALIGVINTVVDVVVFLTAYKILHLPLLPANLLAWIVAVSGSYVLNSLFTFAAESGRRLSLRFYVLFAASGVAGLISNTTTLWLASFLAPVAIAKAMAIGASFVLNFSLSHFVVFKRWKSEDGGKPLASTA